MTAHTPTGGSNRESCAMDESLTPRHRVKDEGLIDCKLLLPQIIDLWRISTG